MSGPPAPVPLPPRRGRIARAAGRLVRLVSWLALLVLLVLAALGAWSLAARYDYPETGLVLRVVQELPGEAAPGAGAERGADFLYGERLGDLRSLRPGNSLGSVRRRGRGVNPAIELRDGQGRRIAAVEPAPAGDLRFPGLPDGPVRLLWIDVDAGGGESSLVRRLAVVSPLVPPAGETVRDVYALGPAGLTRVRRLIERRGALGLLGDGNLAGSVLEAFDPSGTSGLVLASDEGGVLDLLPQGSALGFLEPAPGLWVRMLGRDQPALRFRFTIAARYARLPWPRLTGGYVIGDGTGELGAVLIESFALRYRGQTLYHYLVDLDGNGRLDRAVETIETVLVARPPAAAGSRAMTISFLAGPARIADLEALRLSDAIEAYLVDACRKGFGRDSDLGAIEEARDQALALLDPTPASVAATLDPIDPLRSAHAMALLPLAARRAYAGAMTAALGARLAEVRFATPDEVKQLGPRPGLAPIPLAAAASPIPADGGAASPGAAPAPVATSDLPFLPEPEARLLAHAEALLREVGETVWPGFGASLPPIVLIGAEVEWLSGHRRIPEDFAWQGVHPVLGREVYARKRTFDPTFQASFPINGVPTVVLGTAAAQGLAPERWALTYVHEAFHAFQMEKGEYEKTARLAHLAAGDATGMWQLNYPFPYSDPAAGQALALAGTALDRALGALSGAQASGAEAAAAPEAVRAALAAREALAALVPANDVDYLRFVEWKEGGARYAEMRAANLAAAAGLVPPAPRSAAPYSDAAADLESALRETLRNLGPGRLKRESFYATGAALARILESRDPGFKARYFEPAATLDTLLAEAGTSGPRPPTSPSPAGTPATVPASAAEATPAPSP